MVVLVTDFAPHNEPRRGHTSASLSQALIDVAHPQLLLSCRRQALVAWRTLSGVSETRVARRHTRVPTLAKRPPFSSAPRTPHPAVRATDADAKKVRRVIHSRPRGASSRIERCANAWHTVQVLSPHTRVLALEPGGGDSTHACL